MKIRANGIDIEIEDSAQGSPQTADAASRPVVLLIMGLGMQLVAWPQDLVDGLVEQTDDNRYALAGEGAS